MTDHVETPLTQGLMNEAFDIFGLGPASPAGNCAMNLMHAAAAFIPMAEAMRSSPPFMTSSGGGGLHKLALEFASAVERDRFEDAFRLAAMSQRPAPPPPPAVAATHRNAELLKVANLLQQAADDLRAVVQP